MELEIEAAKSFEDGIDFISKKKFFLIRARRDAAGKIVVSKGERTYFSQPTKSKKQIPIRHFFLIFVLSLFITVTLHLNVSSGIKALIYIVATWLLTFMWYYIQSQKETEFVRYRYHAAEHKVLNYLDRYHQAPRDIYELKNTSSISYRCGSTLIAVFYALASLMVLSIMFLPYTGLKVIGCVLSFLIVFLLWALGYLDFFQGFIIKEPTLDELEVAYVGILTYVDEMKKE